MAKIMCRYFKLNGYYLVTNNSQPHDCKLLDYLFKFNFLLNCFLLYQHIYLYIHKLKVLKLYRKQIQKLYN